MDFFGFHPLYVVILIALALIIFGPSRLPKMGAQVGRMMREFQAAREGLTQQMRDAFEEDSDADGPTVAEEDDEPDSELATSPSTGPAVAVLDPPEGESGLEDPEATPDVAGETQAAIEAATATDEPQATAVESPSDVIATEDPETAAVETPSEVTAAEEPEAAAVETPSEVTAAEEPEATAVEPSSEVTATEEPQTAAAVEPPVEGTATAEPEAATAVPEPADTEASEPENRSHNGTPAAGEDASFASVTADEHQERPQPDQGAPSPD
ncbi:MAG: twin-arginine translocase TatA/TatE family subunit [Candidatus Dormibacteraeota bacterium]|nr:twin-arginine translocase TatA/TatE family subunit [Candidatus Dormibacteraeota bacterium]